MYRSRLWTMRQYAGFGSARESNRRYRYLLEQGQTGLSVAFDLPTQMGYDSDDPLARGEVGKAGVAISTIEDMRLLTDGLPLDRVSISMTINSTAAVLLALLLSVARERGIGWDALSGTVQNDILKEYAARGTYIFPPGRRSRSRRTSSSSADERFRGGTRSRFRGTTSARRGRRRSRRSLSRWRTALPTSKRRSPAASPSIRSRRASLSSSTPTRTSSRRSRNSVRRARSGRKSCATASGRRIRGPGGCASTRRRRARLSRRSSRTSTSSGSRCRRSRRSSGEPSRSTPTAPTRRSLFRPSGPPVSPCGRSRSSPTRPASPTSQIRSAAPHSSRAGPRRSDHALARRSRGSTRWAELSPLSKKAGFSGRSRRPPTSPSGKSRRAGASWWG